MTVAGPIWIGGTGRSGTTALARLLGQHPEIYRISEELRFHSVPQGLPSLLRGRRSLREFRQWMDCKAYQRPPRGTKARGLQLRMDWHRYTRVMDRFEELYEKDRYMAVRELFTEVIRDGLEARQLAHWVECTPANASAADILLPVFPESKLLVTVRDGRDVAASVVNQPWGPHNWSDALDWWAQRARQASDAIRVARDLGYREAIVSLDFDTFVSQQGWHAYRTLLHQLGLADHPRLSDFYTQKFSWQRAHTGRWQYEFGFPQFDSKYRELYARLAHDDVWPLPSPP